MTEAEQAMMTLVDRINATSLDLNEQLRVEIQSLKKTLASREEYIRARHKVSDRLLRQIADLESRPANKTIKAQADRIEELERELDERRERMNEIAALAGGEG